MPGYTKPESMVFKGMTFKLLSPKADVIPVLFLVKRMKRKSKAKNTKYK
jgi:hypothetical protein